MFRVWGFRGEGFRRVYVFFWGFGRIVSEKRGWRPSGLRGKRLKGSGFQGRSGSGVVGLGVSGLRV